MFSHLGLEGSLTTKSTESTLCGANKDGQFKSNAISQGFGTKRDWSDDAICERSEVPSFLWRRILWRERRRIEEILARDIWR